MLDVSVVPTGLIFAGVFPGTKVPGYFHSVPLGRENGVPLGRENGVPLGRENGVPLGRENGVTMRRENG